MPRKKPFSAKQKKKQLQDKRERKHDRNEKEKVHVEGRPGEHSLSDDEGKKEVGVFRVNEQPITGKAFNPNRYRLHFFKETKKELTKRKENSMKPLMPVSEVDCEMSFEDIYKPGSVLDMPKRPPWDYSQSKSKLEYSEQIYFEKYVETIFQEHTPEELSYFELNLETWRQLWRVLEISDIILLITDIRYPVLHLSPALYDYVIKDLQKSIILVLNKVDLAPPGVVVAWKHYLQQHYPQLHIVCFTTQPKTEEDRSKKGVSHKRRKGKRPPAVGPRDLWQACNKIVNGAVDLSSWRQKIEQESAYDASEDESDGDEGDDDGSDDAAKLPPADLDTSYEHREKYQNSVLTIGCIGYPNVGKSSLINGLNGKKVVSVSKTPGHTKHFQTIFLTSKVRLCDCPGLVFPSLVPKPLQILAGMYPVSQVREPYSVVQYLAERMPLPEVLKVQLLDEDETTWSAWDICEAWAAKRGFMTAKAARYDAYRAANNILRCAVEGTICLCMKPLGYTAHKDDWENHQETREIAELQSRHCLSVAEMSSEEEGTGTDESSEEIESDEIAEDNQYVNPYALLDCDA